MTATTTDSARRDRIDPPAVGGGDGSAALSWPGMTAGVGAVVAGAAAAGAEPTTERIAMSTRRLRARPASSALEAAGWVSP